MKPRSDGLALAIAPEIVAKAAPPLRRSAPSPIHFSRVVCMRLWCRLRIVSFATKARDGFLEMESRSHYRGHPFGGENGWFEKPINWGVGDVLDHFTERDREARL